MVSADVKSELKAYQISRNGSKEAHLLTFIEMLSQILPYFIIARF